MILADNEQISLLRTKIDLPSLRNAVETGLAQRVNGRNQADILDGELRQIFDHLSPEISNKFGIDIWDALVLLNEPVEDVGVLDCFEDWKILYESLSHRAKDMGVEVTLQEDYSGTNTFHIWCPRGAFVQFSQDIEKIDVWLKNSFEITVVEYDGDDVTGVERIVTIPANFSR